MRDEVFEEAIARRDREVNAEVERAHGERDAMVRFMLLARPYWDRFPKATIAGVLEMMPLEERQRAAAFLADANTPFARWVPG